MNGGTIDQDSGNQGAGGRGAGGDAIRIDDGLSIPRGELAYRATRSGGPGGQHVNTTATRVELTWDLAGSPSLSDEQRQRLLARLATRIDSAGVLRLTASRSRSQARNKEEVTERFRTIVVEALRERKRRKPTRPTRASKEARLRAKRRRAEVKRRRGPIDMGDE
jgi:ribosome-associated protein